VDATDKTNSDLDEINKARAIKAIQDLILVVYIALPFALYIDVIKSLKVNFSDEVLIFRVYFALGIFFIISLLLIYIEALLIEFLFDKNKAGYKSSVFKSIRTSIYLSVFYSFLIIVFISFATDNTDLNNLRNISFSSILFGLGYSVSIYIVLCVPLLYTKKEIKEIVDITFDVTKMPLTN